MLLAVTDAHAKLLELVRDERVLDISPKLQLACKNVVALLAKRVTFLTGCVSGAQHLTEEVINEVGADMNKSKEVAKALAKSYEALEGVDL